jgi:cytosine/adenosine deaminase-related metal-dependent hydrolase
MALGTDTAPQSMLEALKFTAVVSKLVDRRTEVATAADVFNAATLGGARALGRDDLGRIAPGAKADLLFFDATSLWMTPLRDPVKNIVYSAQAHDIADVMVNGKVVLRDRVVLGLNEREVCERLQAGGERMWPAMCHGHWARQDVDTLSPHSFPAWEGA